MQMKTTATEGFSSALSLRPLLAVLKKMIEERKPGAAKMYGALLREVENNPVLSGPVTDATALQPHTELIEALLSTIFPPSTAATQGMYAVSFPFQSETVYASQPFADQFLKEGTTISAPDNRTNYTIAKASLQLAYNLVLRTFYSWDLPVVATSVHSFTDVDSGLTKYLELEMNAQFVEVEKKDENFALPTQYNEQQALDMDELTKRFPIDAFHFAGLMVITVKDVTSEQVVAEIKNTLLDINAFSDVTVYDKLQEHIQTFLGSKDVQVGITPFFKVNNYYLFSDLHYRNSYLFKNSEVQAAKYRTVVLCQQTFKHVQTPVLYHSLSDKGPKLLHYYYTEGARSVILCPLKCDDGDLIGLLEVVSTLPGRLRYKHASKLQQAMQLFTLALEKSIEGTESQIDKTIKEHFTAIQPAVEWKFTDAAFEYLQHRQDNEMAKIPAISFNDVYPLYAAIDVKNSSLERSNAIQLDLLEQLHLVHAILDKGSQGVEFPLLKEIKFKVEKFIASTTENLLSEDEIMIYDFLQQDLDSLFRHLHSTRPDLKTPIDDYFSALDPQKNIIYHHRKRYEDTITKINDTLDRFMDREQASMQQIYPHYFERYITDGIDFNIYIGQSMAPHHPFDPIYVSNLKMWQLTLLIKAARLTNALQKKLPLPLQTTQLILAHCIPLSISFRRKERKFDVDGAYNIRYEIVKKRIDKVHLRDSEERLTQPGKIAIVYSQQKELNEYLEYIEFLQAEGMLSQEIEYLELEEMQGISGLKALRMEVLLNAEKEEPKIELSKVTSQQLLRK